VYLFPENVLSQNRKKKRSTRREVLTYKIKNGMEMRVVSKTTRNIKISDEIKDKINRVRVHACESLECYSLPLTLLKCALFQGQVWELLLYLKGGTFKDLCKFRIVHKNNDLLSPDA